jgi:hypothetical protein
MTEHKTDEHQDKEHGLGRQHPAAGHETNQRADDKKTAREGEHVTGMAADQVTTEPSSPPHQGGKMVAAIIGPMRGHVLIMPEAEADQAINDHWAVEQTSTHDQDKDQDDQHPPLDDAEREAAEAAAKAWSDKAHGIEPPPTEPPPEVEPPPEDATGLRRTVPDRGMRPDPGGSYQTRDHLDPTGRPATGGTPHPAPKPEPPKPQPKPEPPKSR